MRDHNFEFLYIVAPHKYVSYIVCCVSDKEVPMGEVWKTKYGFRRVKQAKPDLREAISAARDISNTVDGQAEIAAALIGLPIDMVKSEIVAQNAREKHFQTKTIQMGNSGKTVVVERSMRRRPRTDN